MTVEIIKPATRSFSALTSWLRCGKAYQLSRIQKVPRAPAWWFIGGNAVHRATERYDRALYRQEGR